MVRLTLFQPFEYNLELKRNEIMNFFEAVTFICVRVLK